MPSKEGDKLTDTQTVVLIPESSSRDSTAKPSAVRPRLSVHYGLRQREFEEKYKHGKEAGGQSESMWQRVKKGARKQCTKDSMINVLHSRFPVIRVIGGYRWKKDILGDLLAGVSVGVMTIPQSLGYALLASVPAVLGLYTSVFPVLIYFMFSTSRHVSIGTMALSCLVIAAAVQRGIGRIAVNQVGSANHSFADVNYGRGGVEGGNGMIEVLHADVIEGVQGLDVTAMSSQSRDVTSDVISGSASGEWSQLEEEQIVIAVSVSCLAGLIMIGMGVCKLGFIVSYMSEAFISGYLASSNIRVVTHQIALILGIKPTPRGLVVGEYFMFVYDLLLNIGNTNLIQLMISVITLVVLLLVKQCINERFKHCLKVPIPIDVVAIALATFLSYQLSLHVSYNVQVLGAVPSGLPAPVAPSVRHMMAHVFDAVMLAIISYLMVAMMARLFSDRHGYEIDCDQELLANGLACVGGSFFRSLACSTSPPRCFLMEATGGRTQLAHLFSSIVVLLAVCFIAPLFSLLPVCVLACVIIVACVPLFVHYRMWLTYYRTDPYDLSAWVVTASANLLLSVDIGLVVGVAFSLVSTHYRMQKSVGVVLECHDEDFIFHESATNYHKKTEKTSESKNIAHATTVQDFVSNTSILVENVKNSAADMNNTVRRDSVKNCEQEQRASCGNNSKLSESVFLFRFESPLYYATLDVFKQQLYLRTVSLTQLRAELKKRVIQEKRREKSERSSKEVRFVQTKSKAPGRFSDEGPGNTVSTGQRPDDEEVMMINKNRGEDSREDGGACKVGAHDGIEDNNKNTVLGGKKEEETTSENKKQEEDKINVSSDVNDDDDDEGRICIVVDCSAMPFLDTGGAKLLAQLYDEYRKVNVRLVLAGCTIGMRERLARVGQCSSLNQQAVYPSVQDAVMCVSSSS